MILVKRFAWVVPTFLILSGICFALVHSLPGTPLDVGAKPVWLESRELSDFYGLSDPLPARYLKWLGNLLSGNAGTSIYFGEPVFTVIGRALPISLWLGLSALLSIYVIAVPLGVRVALGRKSGLFSFFVMVHSLPSYLVGLGLIAMFGRVFPIQGIASLGVSELSFFERLLDILWHSILPIASLVVVGVAPAATLVRNALLDQLSKDYFLAAKAKGLTERRLTWLHAGVGASYTLSTHLGREIAYLVSGTLFIEAIFGIPGMGRLAYDSLLRRDYPVMMGVVLVLGTLQILGGALSEVLYGWVDPKSKRVSGEGAQ